MSHRMQAASRSWNRQQERFSVLASGKDAALLNSGPQSRRRKAVCQSSHRKSVRTASLAWRLVPAAQPFFDPHLDLWSMAFHPGL